jgi:pimeloyl-ACP methyl ester carboxylesterase
MRDSTQQVKRRPRWRVISVRALIIIAAVTAVAFAVVAYTRVEIGAHLIAAAPNRGKRIDLARRPTQTELNAAGVATAFRVDVGPPPASLMVWIVEPPPDAGVAEPRGTTVYLHGIYDRKESLLPTALSHAARGYRGVLVDARGHGESTGDWITYGAVEARDYTQVLDALAERGLLTERVAVYGASYGAGTGVQFAARDPRVDTAVLLAPFADMRGIVRDRTRSLRLAWLFTDATLDAAIARAGQLAGCDPNDSSGVAALRARPIPVLIIHGRRDRTIPLAHAERLITAADPRSKLVIVEEARHHDWTAGGHRTIYRESTAWLDQWLATSASAPAPSE